MFTGSIFSWSLSFSLRVICLYFSSLCSLLCTFFQTHITKTMLWNGWKNKNIDNSSTWYLISKQSMADKWINKIKCDACLYMVSTCWERSEKLSKLGWPHQQHKVKRCSALLSLAWCNHGGMALILGKAKENQIKRC